jgi:AcrR family transcriptional regulator
MGKQLTKREENKAESRSRLMAAARWEFARKGHAGTSLRNITTRAGLSTGAFYNNFRDKREIYLAILEEISQTLRAIMEEAVAEILEARKVKPRNTSTADLIRVPLMKIFQCAMEHHELFDILQRDGLGRDSEFREYYAKILEDFIQATRRGLDAYIVAGFSRPYNTEMLARVAVMMLSSMVIYGTDTRPDRLEELINTMAAMIHGGAKQIASRSHMRGESSKASVPQTELRSETP